MLRDLQRPALAGLAGAARARGARADAADRDRAARLRRQAVGGEPGQARRQGARVFSSGAGGLRAFARWLADQRAASRRDRGDGRGGVGGGRASADSARVEGPRVSDRRAREHLERAAQRRRSCARPQQRRLHVRILKNGRRSSRRRVSTPRWVARDRAEGGRVQAAAVCRGDASARSPDRAGGMRTPARSMLADLAPFLQVRAWAVEIDGARCPRCPRTSLRRS